MSLSDRQILGEVSVTVYFLQLLPDEGKINCLHLDADTSGSKGGGGGLKHCFWLGEHESLTSGTTEWLQVLHRLGRQGGWVAVSYVTLFAHWWH